MIIDGKKIAEELIMDLQQSFQAKDGVYTLGVVMNQGDPASQSFVKMKERVAAKVGVELKRFDASQMQEALQCDGVIVQLPIPNAEGLLSQIIPEKDVDALGAHPIVRAPVAEAVRHILAKNNIDPKGKKVVVVGEGKLVGKPVAELLSDLGGEVHVVSLEQGTLDSLKDADIVVSGAGSPGLIKPNMLKPGVVLIDAGTSESAGKVVGDCDPACAEVALLMTPVPGGVGPVAVAMLFKNLLTLIDKK